MRTLRLTFVTLLMLSLSVAADDRASTLDSLLTRYTELGQFNGAVLVADGDEILLRRGYGFADHELELANKAETQFLVGSISKSLTADLVFQYVDEGFIKLSDSITDHLPYYRGDTGSKITIQHLLTHSDGLSNYTNNPEFWQPVAGGALSTQEFIETWCSSDLQFQPGTEYRYGNTSYSILGAIIEQISGEPFAKVLRERILDSVGMQSSGDIGAGSPGDTLAKGYQVGPNGFQLAEPVYTPMFAAAGIYTTVDDLLAYLNAIDQGLLLRRLAATEQEGLFTYGWLVAELSVGSDEESARVLSTNGEINGYNAFLVNVIDSRHVVILFSNIGETDLVAMAGSVISVLNGRTPPQPALRTRDRFYTVLQEQGVDAAIRYYRSQREIDPDDYIYQPWPLRILASQLLGDNRHEDATKILELNLETYPDDMRSKQMLGGIISPR